MSTIHTVTLTGCSPVPLAHYLKALGILRLVAEQADTHATGWWNKDRFELNSTLDEAGLVDFFLNRYAPTPVLAPWNGGSGFYRGDNRVAISKLLGTTSTRLKNYQHALGDARGVVAKQLQGARGTDRYRSQINATLCKAKRSATESLAKTIIAGLLSTKPVKKVTSLSELVSIFAANQSVRSVLEAKGASRANLISAWKRSPLSVKKGILESLFASICYHEEARDARQKALGKLLDIELASTKEALLIQCRNSLSDSAVAWLDAAFVLTEDGAKYPPLLGTGGNDGRLEFTNNFMQRLCEVFEPKDGIALPKSEGWLLGSLFALPAATPLSKSPVGQFFPSAAGGVNATSGFDADSAVNPWDFILMIEGALLFAAASVKRLESTEPGVLVYPFCVKQSGVGYGSASTSDESASRAEMWMPLWDKPAKANELQAVLSEGRAQVGGRPARNGVDFARAVVTLGVDRGISSFQRYGFQVRNGLSYFATPLNRVTVKPNTRATLLGEIDPWLASLRRATSASAKPAAPASVSRAFNQLEARILDLCNQDSAARLQAVLIALGRCEKAIAKSSRWSDEARLNPLCELSLDWANLSDTGNAEFRLASALASVTGKFKDAYLTTRCHMEPVNCFKGDKYRWSEVETNNVQWSESPLPTVLNDIFARRLILAERAGTGGLPDYARRFACLSDIKDFIEQRTDDTLLSDLLWGLSLINWTDAPKLELQTKRVTAPALFALLKLCYLPVEKSKDGVPLIPAIHHHAARGNGLEASRLASRRLRGSGLQPAIREIPLSGPVVQRTAAALIFPLPFFEINRLRQLVERPTDEDSDSATSIQRNLETTSV